jgi:hypothetical protein
MTAFCLPTEFILTKVSASGRRYFFTGELNPSETASGDVVLVAQTSHSPKEAYGYISRPLPAALARLLNNCGIGGAPWEVSTLSKHLVSGPCTAHPQEPGNAPPA